MHSLRMLIGIIVFLVGIVLYHLVHTFFVYGLDLVSPELLSVIKDVARLVLVGSACVVGWKHLKTFFTHRKWPLCAFIALLIWSLMLSYIQGMSVGSILVGLKYDLYPLFMLLSACFLGYYFSSQKFFQTITFQTIMSVLIGILLGGVLWQVAKLIFPDVFTLFGYGPVGDYLLGSAPPIRYRTGPGGIMRLQGLFAGPNNYGFFLVGISGIVLATVVTQIHKKRSWFLAFLFVVSLVRTLSRGARIGAGVACALTVWHFFPRYKQFLLGIGIVGGVALVGLSLMKMGSTLGHFSAMYEGVQAFFRQPRGYGLGMAGPSVHYEGVYLPENQYMQILLDLGLPGCLLWCSVVRMIIKKGRVISRSQEGIAVLLRLFLFGICGLLVAGLFLHVFEDSMVNYLILGIYALLLGMILGTESSNTKK